MAELGDIQVAPDGQPNKLTPQGWVPISVEQAQQESRGAAERFIGGALGAETSGTAGALGQLTGLATVVGGPASAGVRAGVGAAKRGVQQVLGGKMSTRVQQKIQQTAGREAENVIQGAFPGAPARSVGAAETVPGATQPAGLTGRLADEFFTPRPLRTDQTRILQSGRAEELGFRFLPGQREGRNLLVAGAKSDPILAPAFDPVFSGNRETGARLARKALGLEDAAEFGRAELGEAAEQIGARLSTIADDIRPVKLDKDIANRVNRLRKVDDDLDDALDDILGTTKAQAPDTVSGSELLSMRSQLGKAERQAWKQGQDQRGERIGKIVKKIDDIIEENSTNPAARADHALAREQWRTLIQLEKPGVVGDAGDISFERLANNFRKEFKGDFARDTFASSGRLSGETADLLDFTKIASAFKENVGDSGTATRLGIQSLLAPGGLKSLAKRKALQKVLSQLVENEAPL